MAAYLAGKGTIAAIAAEFGIGKATLHRYLRAVRANSALEPKPHAGGAQRRLGKEDEQVLVAFLASHRRASLEEMRVYLAQETGKQVSRMALIQGRDPVFLGYFGAHVPLAQSAHFEA